jgi:hypothetical protein
MKALETLQDIEATEGREAARKEAVHMAAYAWEEFRLWAGTGDLTRDERARKANALQRAKEADAYLRRK